MCTLHDVTVCSHGEIVDDVLDMTICQVESHQVCVRALAIIMCNDASRQKCDVICMDALRTMMHGWLILNANNVTQCTMFWIDQQGDDRVDVASCIDIHPACCMSTLVHRPNWCHQRAWLRLVAA